jgi:hypothetical protein
MSNAERIAWLRLWKRELERGARGSWNRELSLAIDRVVVLLESGAAA